MRQDVIFNGISGSSLKVYAVERPALPVAEKRRQEIEVAGRDGVLTIDSGDFTEKELTIKFNFIVPHGKWNERCQEIKEWLSAENCELQLSDDTDHFYRVNYVSIKEIKRPSERIGTFEAVFVTRDGLRYLKNGQSETQVSTSGTTLNNKYVRCFPTFKIRGNGTFSIEITHNSVVKKMTGQVSGDMIIDTENMLAYRNDGTSQNRLVTGDYSDLWLEKGNNTIKANAGISSSATVSIIPNWRRL